MIKIILIITVIGLVQCGPAKLRTSRVTRDIRIFITFPGTKWCGSGTTANDYNELGNAWEEDQCCREHDHCSDVIPPERRKHNLLNDSAYTRTSCDCDDKFYRCLKKINSKTAYFIGVLYFNIYNAKCFKKDYKMTVCATKRTFFSKCKDYERDYSRPQLYQWFESPNF